MCLCLHWPQLKVCEKIRWRAPVRRIVWAVSASATPGQAPAHQGKVVTFPGACKKCLCVWPCLGMSFLSPLHPPHHTCLGAAVHCVPGRSYCPALWADRMEPCLSGAESGGRANKRTFERARVWGLPASKGLLFPQREVHDFVPEEMSHLHSGTGGVWRYRGEYRENKCKRNLRSVLRTKINCSILRTMIFAK